MGKKKQINESNTFGKYEVYLTIEDLENSTIKDTFSQKNFEELLRIILQIVSINRLKVEKKDRGDILKIKTIKNAPMKIKQTSLSL